MLKLPDLTTLVNESDVEQKVVMPLLTAPEPYGFGYSVAELPTKANIRSFMIGKGTTAKLYFPDYLAVLGGLPHVVVEAKAPGVELDEAFREARLYANELNAALPTNVNPVLVVIAINAAEIWAGPVDQAEPQVKEALADVTVYSPKFAEILRLAGRTAVSARNRQLLATIRPSVLRKPRRLLGGDAVQNEEIGHNSFGAAIQSEFSHIFNPSTYEERAYIARHGYVPSRRRERYVDPIDRVIRASRPPSELHAREMNDTAKPAELLGKLASSTDLDKKVLLIVGSVGSGKTTFIDHLREVALSDELRETTLWLRLNMNVAPANKDEIFNWVRQQLIAECQAAYQDIDFESLDAIRKLYAVEVNAFHKGVGQLYGIDTPLYNQKLAETLVALQEDLQKTAQAYTRFCGTERGKLVITVFDNCDKRTREVQLLMFEVAQWMQKEFRTLVMLPLRDETFDNYRDTPPLDTALKDFVFRIEPPLFHQVLTTRVQLALNLFGSDSPPLAA
ncbi:hypothetical protein R69658_07489 [Paraburkholderia aspalathi]|uniref:Restriction endonuclease type I HsdR N-terminal domain-containing protein n=1 Tax=Paraburkholderia aspalathi TaxID=1324617 RepID=A0ABN7NDX3_9BURK|nr:type I restriction enzyme HsdR N-terminal domain-containing protein [Paraburkholderia aspalathi]MBK3823784.1 hypothetical protein [Paraburkholderia aspalathi]MBK3835633.1 hypothetical protein [Paraburkholderia aspalathi]MBK3865049.1 hypothetical protein [Paraburkholderia aspalathi]CAE6858119.1 hypothetical protein R69658_07489 [Paraburkholderia aspalathi]